MGVMFVRAFGRESVNCALEKRLLGLRQSCQIWAAWNEAHYREAPQGKQQPQAKNNLCKAWRKAGH